MRPPTPDRSLHPIAVSLVLALAALVFWSTQTGLTSLAAAIAGAVIGSIMGLRAAYSRLRSRALVLLVSLFALAGYLVQLAVEAIPVPESARFPESIASLHDGLVIGWINATLALVVVSLAARLRTLRPLPTGILVLATAFQLAAHRGGSIHRPTAIADPAWIRGWNPILALTLCGLVAAVIGGLALFRRGRSRWIVLHGLAWVLAAVVFLIWAPASGVLGLQNPDPLPLTSSQEEPRERIGTGVGKPGQRLGAGEGEGLPWLDDYSGGARPRVNSPLAVVLLHDEYEPVNGYFYFRQEALSAFNGIKLTRSADPRVDRDVIALFPFDAEQVAEAPVARGARRELRTTVALLADLSGPAALIDALEIDAATNPDDSLFVRVYDVNSSVLEVSEDQLLETPVPPPDWPETVRRTYLELPDDPRYRELGSELVGMLRAEYRDHPFARALAVRHWLSLNTRYSLRAKHSGTPDPTADFLFGDRIGYCTHLSHAAAYLMRAMQVPARVAHGLAYRSSDRGSGSALLLRASDAHAWAEVYLTGFGWIPIDPSPEPIDPPTPSPDVDLQRLLGELARAERTGATDEPRARPQLPTLGELALGLGAVALLVVSVGYGIKLWRWLAPGWVRSDRRARVAYRAALDRLGELGLARAIGETREAFARRAAKIAPAFDRLTSAHVAASFGRHAIDAVQANALMREVGHDLRAQSRWRRWWGRLRPFSWLESR